MPTIAAKERDRATTERSYACLDVLKTAGVWMTAWAVAQELDLSGGRQVRGSLERLAVDGSVEVHDSLASSPGFGRHYKAL